MSTWLQDRPQTIAEIEDARASLIAVRDTIVPGTSLYLKLDAAIHELDEALRGLQR